MKTRADSRRPEHLSALRQALWRMPRATRAQLSEATGLSAMTVGKLLCVMERYGEVRQDETERTAGGRPSVIAQYNGGYAHFASIVVEQFEGRSAFALSVYDLLGTAVHEEQMLLGEVRADSFDDFFARAKAQYRLELAVFVLPGIADGDRMLMCDLAALTDGQVLQRIRRCFGVEVLFENDVNGAVFGHSFGETRQGVFAGMYFPQNYCPGAGLVVDGEILYGAGHFAGEIGYIQGIDAWMELDYADAKQTAAMISQLLAIYCCTTAPRHIVLYGSFFTPELECMIAKQLDERLLGHFAPGLSFKKSLTQDMQRGAVRLGLRRMRAILDKRDERDENKEG